MVGMQMCRNCHADVYDTYIQTGMGQSFGSADWHKTAAKFGKEHIIYDKEKDMHYYPFLKDSILFVLEYRLEGEDTTYQRLEKIDYIIGSGHHTNSHLLNRNGYIYQAPITYYTQDGKWDLAPGFEDGNNKRFDRAILSECMTCHNHYPTPASGSENKYHKVPLGIECERCHGAGGLHVQEKLSGKKVDTSKAIDYSIINPRHLPIDKQMDLCQRCHLQGITVLNEGKTFYDFKPGMALADVMNVFLPRFTDSDKRFIMASQADRLQLSECFTVSGELSCITCHNPHHNVHATDKNRYNASCISCHNPKTTKSKLFDCSETPLERDKLADNCVQCHMPKSGSIDIPHVNISDHFIGKKNTLNRKQKDTLSEEKVEDIANFLGLQSLVIDQPTPLDMAKGYLALYDKFMGSPIILDSVDFYLKKATQADPIQKNKVLIHYYFNRNEFAQLLAIAPAVNTLQDAWTAYRIGEAAIKLRQLAKAKDYYTKATQIHPYNLEFQEKKGTTLAQLKELAAAQKTFEFILAEDAHRKMAWSNLGLLFAQQGKVNKALQHYNQALALDPDYKNALLNKIGLLVYLKREKEAQSIIQHLIKKYPEQKSILKNKGIL
jgi:tetratricopeptide (TPR) repeat protein